MSRPVEIDTTSESSFDAQIRRKANAQCFEGNCANDSGFCEPEHSANKSYCYDSGHSTQTESLRESSTEARIPSTEVNDQENDQNLTDEYPVPKSSSTPSRVEIFIDENWNKANEEINTAHYDENTPPETAPRYILESQSRIKKNARRKRTSEEPCLRESNSINCKTELFGEDDKETKFTESKEGDFKFNRKTDDHNCVVAAADPLRKLLVYGVDLEPEKDKKDKKEKDKEVDDISEENSLQIPAHNRNSISEETHANLSNDIAQDGSRTNGNNKTVSVRKKRGRKSKTPRRSPTKCDPRFKGVTVWLQTEYKEGRSRLNISAFYSNVKALFSDRPRRSLFGNHVFTCSPDPYSFSETEDSSTPTYGRETYLLGEETAYLPIRNYAVKTCASCHTRRTPLWRDAEDGTPLCNACGIRYKKYRLRCSRCWHIPKKDIKTYPNCPTCGASLRYVFTRRTW